MFLQVYIYIHMNKYHFPQPCPRRRIKTSVEDAYFRHRGHTAFQPARSVDLFTSLQLNV